LKCSCADFQDKVGRTLVLFKCSCADFEGEVDERETWEIKGGNFRVEGLLIIVLLGWETL